MSAGGKGTRVEAWRVLADAIVALGWQRKVKRKVRA